jgi:hypothetical protein
MGETRGELKPVVGMIGLGNLGKPMSLSLLSSDYELVVNSLQGSEVDDLVMRGALWAQSPSQVAAQVILRKLNCQVAVVWQTLFRWRGCTRCWLMAANSTVCDCLNQKRLPSLAGSGRLVMTHSRGDYCVLVSGLNLTRTRLG